jgi:C-terminal processing protease CtpA/Prc
MKKVKRIKKMKCAPDCTGPCCADMKKVKRIKKMKCAPDCTGPCCSGEKVSEIKVMVSDGDHVWVSDGADMEHLTLHDGHAGLEDVYVMRAGGAMHDDAEGVKKIRILRDGDDDDVVWHSDDEDAAWLGVYLQDLNEDLREAFDLPADLEGAIVTDVVRSGPARKAGVRKGFVIVEFDGNPVRGADDLIKLVKMSEPGDRIELVMNRKGHQIIRRVTLGKMPQERVTIRKAPQVEKFYFDDDEDGEIHIRIPEIDIELEDLHKKLYRLHGKGAYLGVGIEDYDDEGVLVNEVYEDTAAEEYGVEEGDIIYEIDGAEVEDTEELIEEISAREPGDVVVLYLERDGDPMKLKVELGHRSTPTTLKMKAPKKIMERKSEDMKAKQLEMEIKELKKEIKHLKKKLAEMKDK